jgi:FKBP-type peptidyl-prolyl cis-trans isomerase
MTFATLNKFALVLLLCSASITSALAADQAFRSAAGGLKIKDLQMGQGSGAVTGQVATIHFVGWIDEQGARGREIYNSRAQGQPVSFVIGTDGVMQGWNEGVLGMKPGGKRMLLVPPGMAYGKRKVEGVVPENASLMFRIELIELKDPGGS